MAARGERDPLLDVLTDFVLAAQVKQHRLARVFGEEHGWEIDVPGARWTVGEHSGRLDLLGSLGANEAWLWAWANPSVPAEAHPTASMLFRVGHQWELPVLVTDEETTLDPHVAGIVGTGIGEADGYYVGAHEEGAVVFLLRHRALRHEPCRLEDLVPVLTMLAGGELGVDPRAALEALADDPPAGFEVEVGRRGAKLAAPGGRALVELDRRGRVSNLVVDADPDFPGAPVEPDPPEELVDVATLDFPGGELVVSDPCVPAFAAPRPGALPAGTFRLAVELDREDGDERVAVAHLVLADGPVDAWQPVGSVFTDSGVIAFAARPGVAVPLERRAQTWAAGAVDGAVAVSIGVGAGEYELLHGYDAQDELIRIAVHALPEPPGETDPPPTGLQRAVLTPLHAGGDLSAENVVPLPPPAQARLAAAQGRLLEVVLNASGDRDAAVVPEYEGDAPVPTRIRLRLHGADFDETVEV
jgi:hypothetical protein